MKREIWIGSLLLKYFGIVITFVALFSSCTKDEDIITPPPIPTPEWKTVFFDDFNRANTVNGDLGSNWGVINVTNRSTMQIINNEVRSVEGRWYPCALYFQELNSSTFRISVKMRTDSLGYAAIVLFARVDTSNLSEVNFIESEGYFIGYYSGSFFISGPTIKYINPIGDLSANTTYILEIITDSTKFEATIINSSTGDIVERGTIGSDLISGLVGFMAGGSSLNDAVYVDDFKIEILE